MVEVVGLSKRFGRRQVLRELTLCFPPGRLTVLVGPNGAGKTTLLKCLVDLVRPQQGSVLLDGLAVGSDPRLRRRIGYVSQLPRFPEQLSAAQVIELLAALRASAPVRRDEVLDTLGLESEIHRPLSQLSGGTRKKVSAALALIFDPEILVMDEPTAGLDPRSALRLKDWLRAERGHGKTVILASHLVSELEELSDRIVFLMDGAVWFDGAAAELRARSGEQNLERALARLVEERIAAALAEPSTTAPIAAAKTAPWPRSAGMAGR